MTNQVIPHGWKLVPIEPTQKMWAAVNKLDDEMAAGAYDGKGASIEQVWACLVDAAPSCLTCNGHGIIGGPSFHDPGEGGEPCPDCAATDSAQPESEQLLSPAVSAEPVVAWMTEDGLRVATDATKRSAMPRVAQDAFCVALVRRDAAPAADERAPVADAAPEYAYSDDGKTVTMTNANRAPGYWESASVAGENGAQSTQNRPESHANTGYTGGSLAPVAGEVNAALDEWLDKTDFIQERIASGDLPVKYLGWHRADVMRDLIDGSKTEPLNAAPQASTAADARDAKDAARWRFISRKLCLVGNRDGTCSMHAINLPGAIKGWPEPGDASGEFYDAAIDAAIAAQQGEGGE
ncbi:hypothetical protein [Bordetella avium]|uniref:hypothetical protein n=1 Tax=Bordetella avium TaxID=521 RepID=UPI000E6A073B|nr:hypothetical protein [Bordetella avium]RIQ54220.1 hypothetical protein D0841_17190 [Bordetella avium]